MNLTIFLILSTLIISSTLGFSQAQAPQESKAKLKHPTYATLWKITGKDLKKPSYFFGTLHSADPRCTTLHPNAEKAFKSADTAYFEYDFDKPVDPKFGSLTQRTDGKTLGEAIGPKLTERTIFEIQKIHPRGFFPATRNINTLLFALMLPSLDSYTFSGKPALDIVLYNRAKKKGKTVGGLETRASQLRCSKLFNEEQSITIYRGILDNMETARKSGTPHFIKALRTYLRKKPAAIESFLEILDFPKHTELSKILVTSLVDDRNITMAKNAAKILTRNPKKSHFFVLGAAHYLKKNGVQTLLQKEGYTITPFFE